MTQDLVGDLKIIYFFENILGDSKLSNFFNSFCNIAFFTMKISKTCKI